LTHASTPLTKPFDKGWLTVGDHMDNMITLRPVILESDFSVGVGNFALGAKGLVVHVRRTIVSPNEEAFVAAFDTPSLEIPDIEHNDTVLAQLRRQGK
jgi:hypothetical protein